MTKTKKPEWMSKYGWSKKVISLSHSSITVSFLIGKTKGHRITVATDGDINKGKHSLINKPFNEVINIAKKRALRMGEHTTLMIHGASENFRTFLVLNGKLMTVYFDRNFMYRYVNEKKTLIE